MHPWVKGNQVCLNEGLRPFPRGDYYKKRKTKLKKSLLQNHWANFNQFWHKAYLGEDSNEKAINYHKVKNGFFSSLNQRYDIIICVYFLIWTVFFRWAMWLMGRLFNWCSKFFFEKRIHNIFQIRGDKTAKFLKKTM